MRLLRTDFQGLTRFSQRVTVDYSSMGPGLVALVGKNGAGKTTIAEAAPLSLFKRFPTRPGSLYDHCNGKGHVSTTWRDEAGRTIEVRLGFNAERRTTEGHVFIDGEPFNDGKARGFDEQIADLFGSQSLYLASVFSCQDKSGDFLKMKRGERKQLFAELLMLGHLEQMSAQARSTAASREQRLLARREALSEIEAESGRLDELELGLEQIAMDLDVFAGDLDGARAEEAAATEQLARARTAEERSAATATALRSAQRRAEQAADALQAAEAGPGRVQKHADSMLQELRRHDIEAEQARLKRDRDEDIAQARRRAEAIAAKIESAGDPAAIAEDINGLQVGAQKLNKLSDKAQQYRRRLSEATSLRDRLRRTAGLLDSVPCDETLGATCPLLADANTAAGDIPGVDQEISECEKWLAADDPDARAEEVSSLSARINELARAQITAESVPQWRDEIASIEASITARRERYVADVKRLDVDRESRAARIAEIVTALPGELATAEAVLADARKAHESAQADLVAAQEAARKSQEGPSVEEAQRSLAAVVEQRKLAEKNLTDAQRDHTRQTTQIDECRKRSAKAESIRSELAEIETDLTDWTMIGTGLGQQGVQALEIDNAGPEVAEIVNELLRSCYGARFSIRFDTLREKKSGGYSEVFDVTVFDGAHPRQVEALSGGERVIVGEAVSLAIAIFNARKNRVRYRTVFRDETAGALDSEAAQAYVAMLRRAREIGGFHQVVFIAHQAEVYEAADVAVYACDGAVTVGGSADAEAA